VHHSIALHCIALALQMLAAHAAQPDAVRNVLIMISDDMRTDLEHMTDRRC